MQTDMMSAVKADGGFLQHYTKLTGIPVNLDDVRFFQIFVAGALCVPILSAIRRRLKGANGEFLHLYILQSLVASMPIYTRILGYPQAEVVG